MNAYDFGVQLAKQANDDSVPVTPESIAVAKYKKALKRIKQRRESTELASSATELPAKA